MYGAIIFALLIPDNWQETMRPSEPEVQLAMSARWVMISSIGDDNRDYAVRNLSCGKSEPFVEAPETDDSNKPTEKAGGIAANIANRFRDIAQFKVRCSFEAAGVWRNSRKPRKMRLGKGIPPALSDRALKRLPAAAWQQEDHEFIYIARGHCRFMGRTPEEGECHNWVINRKASLAPSKADPEIPFSVRLDCRYLSRTPREGECLDLPVENALPAKPPAEPEMRPIASHVWPGPGTPTTPSVQIALARNWLAHSSGGRTSLGDYMVRNITCLPISKIKAFVADKGAFETPRFQTSCSFEYTKIDRKSKKDGEAFEPRIFSNNELKNVHPLSWRHTQQDMVYVSRNKCPFAGKEIAINNCNAWTLTTRELL